MSNEVTLQAATIQPGTRVEVSTGFCGDWARGFEVASLSQQGYRVRRLSDGAVLSALLPCARLRPDPR